MFKISKYLNVGISFHDSSDTKDTHSVDKNRVILIDKIKKFYNMSPALTFGCLDFRSFVITLSVPLFRKFVLGSDKSG